MKRINLINFYVDDYKRKKILNFYVNLFKIYKRTIGIISIIYNDKKIYFLIHF